MRRVGVAGTRSRAPVSGNGVAQAAHEPRRHRRRQALIVPRRAAAKRRSWGPERGVGRSWRRHRHGSPDPLGCAAAEPDVVVDGRAFGVRGLAAGRRRRARPKRQPARFARVGRTVRGTAVVDPFGEVADHVEYPGEARARGSLATRFTGDRHGRGRPGGVIVASAEDEARAIARVVRSV